MSGEPESQPSRKLFVPVHFVQEGVQVKVSLQARERDRFRSSLGGNSETNSLSSVNRQSSPSIPSKHGSNTFHYVTVTRDWQRMFNQKPHDVKIF